MKQQLIVKKIDRFISPTHGELNLPKVIGKIVDFIEEDSESKYSIIIGTDSQEKGREGVEFVTAVVVHRVGSGGIYFWRRYRQTRPYSLRERIYEEALASLEFANDFLTEFKRSGLSSLNLENELEIHVDIGSNGETREMISEIVGMVLANGFHVKTKPESYAASKVADKHTG